tara:strand:- start:2004 stop:2180 length:177 start_codon:yes stop_codon:yes gene_type:complete
VAVVLLVFVTSLLFIEMYNVKKYLSTNENQLSNLVDDINYNNAVVQQHLDASTSDSTD